MFFFTPRYLKQAKLLHKGLSRFINYKRDILAPAKLDEIEGLRRELEAATKARESDKLEALSTKINDVCQHALPAEAPNDLGDNVEVFFVAIVIALAIRAFIAQPFQIPTGSMQPTLNGINATATVEDTSPGVIKQTFDFFRGRSYVNVVSNYEGFLVNGDPVTEHRFVLFTYCKLHFQDGHNMWIWAPKRQLDGDLGLSGYLGRRMQVAKGPDGQEILTPDAQPVRESSGGGAFVSKGQLLARGTLDTGDSILVNKFAYHFRRPERGEVWVFTTKHIRGIELSGSYDPRHGSQHYIKRLVGTPGDQVEVKPPELWINGQPAQEFGMKRVASKQGDYKGYTHIYPSQQYPAPMNEVTLKSGEYMACGDNSGNSLDSRYWGPVPQRNVVGPALFSYWPFSSHWGVIK